MFNIFYELALYMVLIPLGMLIAYVLIHDIYYEVKERRELEARRKKARLEKYVQYRIDRYLYEHRKHLNK